MIHVANLIYALARVKNEYLKEIMREHVYVKRNGNIRMY